MITTNEGVGENGGFPVENGEVGEVGEVGEIGEIGEISERGAPSSRK